MFTGALTERSHGRYFDNFSIMTCIKDITYLIDLAQHMSCVALPMT